MEKINEFVADWDFALETAIFFELGQPALDHIQDCSCFGEKGQALEPIFVGVFLRTYFLLIWLNLA